MNENQYRISYDNITDDGRFREILDGLQKNSDGLYRVAFFTSITHTPLKLSEIGEHLNKIAERMEQVRAAGFSPGVNILATIGHHCEDLDDSLTGDYTRMTDAWGETCAGSFCMNDESFLRDYVIPLYTMTAKTNPDFIWVDDDVRYGHSGIKNGCFCDRCINIFNGEYGFSYTRDTLREALEQYDVALRRKWLCHQSGSIKRLFTVIRKSVEAVSDDIKLGFMTGERWFEGYDFAGFADALSDGGRKKIMWRPGGGAYSDLDWGAFMTKAREMGRQTAYLPEYVDEVHSEIENFPYNMIRKPPESTAVEAALYMMYGCNGSAFNILPGETEDPVGEILPFFGTIQRWSPFFRFIGETVGREPAHGIHTGWSIHGQAALKDEHGGFLKGWGGRFTQSEDELFWSGLPEAFNFEHACAYALCGAEPLVLTDKKIRRILSGTVYMDSEALDCLNETGYGEYTGFTTGRDFTADAREQYLFHILNDGFECKIRNCRQVFYNGTARELIQNGGEPLSRLIDYRGRELAPCASGYYENSLGGRVFAAGYYPYSYISDYYKMRQLRRFFKPSVPCFAESYARVRVLKRGSCVLVYNHNSGGVDNLEIAVRTQKPSVCVTFEDCSRISVEAAEQSDGFSHFVIPRLNPNGFAVLTDL